jgi:hypothetical protein
MPCAQPDPAPAETAVAALWQAAGLPADALPHASLPGTQPVLPSSFQVATAAQASLGAAALAAAELWHLRSGLPRQQVQVDRRHAAVECSAHALIDGVAPPLWDKLSGLYDCGSAVAAPGHVRIHANFAHHRDAALQVLGLPAGDATPHDAVAAALAHWRAEDFEQAVANAGGVAAAARSFGDWDAHPQARALAGVPPVQIRRLPPPAGSADAPPRPWPALAAGQRPLAGLRVLDLTRILAGPAAARCLAAYGADVLMVNGPRQPNIAAIADMSRGKRSALLDLDTDAGRAALHRLAADAQVFLQGYRPGALARHGFGAAALAAAYPGLVVASLSAWGETGPWASRRGFDSLVQTATGFNLAEAQAAGKAAPMAMPVQILDYAAGHLLAFGTQAALWHQATEGGSWQVQVTLAGVAGWLRAMGQDSAGLAAVAPDLAPFLEDSRCGFGHLVHAGAPVGQLATLRALRHAPRFSATPAGLDLPAMPPGSHTPAWEGQAGPSAPSGLPVPGRAH